MNNNNSSEDNPNTIHYFGYGSLVNINTLQTPYTGFKRAVLNGFRRVWIPGRTVLPDDKSIRIALLSIEEASNNSIDGLVISDKPQSLKKLDEREVSYERHDVSSALQYADTENDGSTVFTYIHQPDLDRTNKTKIIRSYLNAVAQGIINQFGEEGLKKFANQTANFHEIYDDTKNPIYPRATKLTQDEHKLVNQYFLDV